MFNVKTLAGAAALAVAGTASAVPLGDVSNKIVPISASHSAADTSFTDAYEFSVSGTGAVQTFVFDYPLDFPTLPGQEFQLNLLAISLYGSSGELITDNTPSDGLAITTAVTSGSYTLYVLGSASGTLGGTYLGYLASTIPAVPEPETYALMLAGLGAVGFMARRRKNG